MARELFNNAYFPGIALSQGWIKGAGPDFIQGQANLLTSGVKRTLWNGPTEEYVFPSDSGESMELVSTNAADDQTVFIRGLDSNFDVVSQIVTLNGTIPVAIPQQLARVNFVILPPPLLTRPLGDILITSVGAVTTYSVTPVGVRGAIQAVFTVPRGKTLSFVSGFFSMDKDSGNDTNVEFALALRSPGDLVTLDSLKVGLNKQGTSAINLPILVGSFVPEMTDVTWNAVSTSSNTNVTLFQQCVLWDN